MFGLAHCTFFNCLMNGSNHLAESDRRPLHFCPVCLRKLQWSIGFDVLQRYQALEQVSRADGFADEADWLSRRINKLRSDKMMNDDGNSNDEAENGGKIAADF